jgi:rod shape-determining protein MreC
MQAAREVTGSVYSVTSYFDSYFRLRSVNAALLKRLAELETEIYAHQQQSTEGLGDSVQIERLSNDSLIYRFIPARVINNSVSLRENYLTFDKGSVDGIRPDMGVLSIDGAVGVVVNTSPHFSTAISLLNTKYKLNGKIKHNDYFGPLTWDGNDPQYTYLSEIPRYVAFQPGDTIVTSGYSTVFPKGIPIGAIVDAQKQRDDNFTSIRIRLFTNFNRLNEVRIVTNRFQEEQKELEQRTLNLTTNP